MWANLKTSTLVCYLKVNVFIVWCLKENNSIDTAILEHRGQKHPVFGKPLEHLAEAVPREKKEVIASIIERVLRSCTSSTLNVNYRILKSIQYYIKNQFNDLRSDEIWKGFLVCLCTLMEALSISGNEYIHLLIRKLFKKRTLLWTVYRTN